MTQSKQDAIQDIQRKLTASINREQEHREQSERLQNDIKAEEDRQVELNQLLDELRKTN